MVTYSTPAVVCCALPHSFGVSRQRMSTQLNSHKARVRRNHRRLLSNVIRPESRPTAIGGFRRMAKLSDSVRRIFGFTLSLGPFNEGGKMSSTHNSGRVAGFWYLLLSVIAPLYTQQTIRRHLSQRDSTKSKGKWDRDVNRFKEQFPEDDWIEKRDLVMAGFRYSATLSANMTYCLRTSRPVRLRAKLGLRDRPNTFSSWRILWSAFHY